MTRLKAELRTKPRAIALEFRCLPQIKSLSCGMAQANEENLVPAQRDVARLRDISPQQWKSGIAAWLGWLFDGLDMHLYTLVAAPFVMQLLHVASTTDPLVKEKSSWIQAAFLVGWALGGGFFGRAGDLLGRSRALSLTILTYAMFTGLSVLAQTWWQLLICRFLAALGIGGEWAVGSSLLSETWPKRWRPWIAAVLQTGVNIGVLIACLAVYLLAAFPKRYVFLVGILPALVVFWIRRSVPEPQEWQSATKSGQGPPSACGGVVPGRRPADHHADDRGLRHVVDGVVGVHVLEPATPAEPAQPRPLDPGAKGPIGQHRVLHPDRRIHGR